MHLFSVSSDQDTEHILRDTIENIGRLEPVLQGVPCDEIVGVVIYDLPGRDCAAKASNGELAVGELDRYKSEYIDGASHKDQTLIT